MFANECCIIWYKIATQSGRNGYSLPPDTNAQPSVPRFDKFSQLFASFTLGSLKIAQSCILTKITPVKIGSRSFRLRSYIAISSC